MTEKIRILFLSANPWTTSRILVDEEAREIFERIQEGPYRDRFELHKHAATRAIDLQRLLLMHKPNIVHFSGHGSKKHKIILGGAPGRGKTIDQQGLVDVLGLYNHHLRLVLLNACFTKTQARSIAKVIDYSVGTGKGIGDKAGVAFAGAFYRALGFGKSIREAFESARAELVLTKIPRTQGIELFVRDGIKEKDPFPQQALNAVSLRSATAKLSSKDLCTSEPRVVWKTTEERFEITVFKTSVIRRSTVGAAVLRGRPSFGNKRFNQ
jgi:CHAT domain-containing protein